MSETAVSSAVQDEFEKPKGRWGGLLSMAFSFVVDNTEGGLINGLFPVIRDALGLNLGALGIFSSISKFARMIFGPLWAMVADKYGRKKILVFITGVWGIWTALAGLAQNQTQLYILYTLGVIGTVASEPIANGIIVDLFASTERGKAYGSLRAITGLLSVMVTPVMGQLANIENGWRYGMYIMGGMSILSGILIAIFLREPERRISSADAESGIDWKKAVALMQIPTVRLLAGMLIFVTSLVLFSFMVTFMVDVRGFTTADANIVFAAFGLGMMISSVLGGLLGDWAERKNPDKGRIMLMQIYLITFAALTYLATQIAWSTTGFYVIWFVTGLVFSIGFSGCVQPMLSNVVPPKMAGTAFALLFAFIQGLISALLSLAMGFLADKHGLQAVMFWMISVPYALNAIYWFLFYKTYPSDVAKIKALAAQ
ncbi:MAG: MFS transporter [Anaerolineae bacterium]|nr:MFS transporter [Anaerolineae bacterium]MBT7072861.1 MFS transporter [Anaerolineae bacterium]MBT7326308.1 MFS transporter [Anaerolineae bacterium]